MKWINMNPVYGESQLEKIGFKLFLSFRKLSFVVDYNQADAFAGHNQFFEGLTLFHASADEKTLGLNNKLSIAYAKVFIN